MNVRVTEITRMGTERVAYECADLRDCCPQDHDYLDVAQEIICHGRAWIGGGAGPLFMIEAAKS